MGNKRQRLARKRFREANPEQFLQTEPKPPKDPKKQKKKLAKLKAKTSGGGIGIGIGVTKSSTFKKHPLRMPGMRPGESCFICKAKDHIAKHCPEKAHWEKNKICLLCRRRGHSLKNCPDKTDETNDNKLCYNCGKPGHSLSKCPQPLKQGGTKFASCFICNEQGHLSKDCPKNTHGIYPKGGSCKLCGGVTHLAKDCPNKATKNHVTVDGVENRWTGEAKKIKFSSGDDLEDDFGGDHAKNDKEISKSKATFNILGDDAEKISNVKSKNKQGPKVVNFLG